MSEEQLKAFLEKVKGDTGLQEKLKAALDADAVVSIAKEEGFSISVDDLKNTQYELSDEELEDVAGGGTLDSLVVNCRPSFIHWCGQVLSINPCEPGYHKIL